MKRPVTSRRSLFSEIRSRGVIHIAGLYVVGAWVIVQVADIVSQGPMPMPPEAIRLIWAALFLGFPIALLFGWRYDITREGRRMWLNEHWKLPVGAVVTAAGLILNLDVVSVPASFGSYGTYQAIKYGSLGMMGGGIGIGIFGLIELLGDRP